MNSIADAIQVDRFATLLDALPDATAVLDPSGRIVAVNHTWRMFSVDNGGTPETTGIGVNYFDVCTRAAAGGCADAKDVLDGLRTVLDGETVESDLEYPCPSDIVSRWFKLRLTPIGFPIGGAVASHVNISRQKMSEQELFRQASHDSLTGLANRTLFSARVTEALLPRPGRNPVADVGLLYIDLDKFKPVNDIFGHDAGDEVLLTTAHRLRTQVRPQDTVARLGGDEFAVCTPRITAKALAELASRLDASLAEPHQIHGRPVLVGGSVGVYLASAGESVPEAINLADQAMYAIKGSRPPAGASLWPA